MKIKKKIKGLWFYGLSGSGKSHLTKILKNRIKKNILVVDGDEVRKNISFDLGYSIKDRKIQVKRILGISKICLKNQFFPIISTVYMSPYIEKISKKYGIIVIKIIRPRLKMKSKIYKLKKDVIGKDLKMPKLKSKVLTNDGGKNFWKKIAKFIT